jgi:gephyrin
VLKSQTDDAREEKEIEILTHEIKAGENIREVGSDVKAGDTILKKGEGITVIGGEFGLLASVGITEVSVYKKPVVGVLSTGDEIIEHSRDGPLQIGEVRDTNRPTLLTAVRSHGFEAIDLGIASDKYVIVYTSLSQYFVDRRQAWQSGADPSRRAPQVRHNHYIRWRLDGRARSP